MLVRSIYVNKHLKEGKFMPCIRQMREGRELFLHLSILSYLWFKVIFMHIPHFGWQIRVQEELGHKQVWAPKNWCFQIVVLEKNLESALDFKEIKPINPKGNQPLIFIGRTVGWSWSSNSLATWCEELTHWKGPWSWERLRAGGKGSDRGWDV